MDRLTFRDDEMKCECPVRCDEDDDVSQFCNQVCDEWQSNCPYMNMGKKLKHYEELEEKGLLVELPCKVGDTVYEIFRGRIQEYTIISIHISRCSTLYGWTLKTEYGVYSNVLGFEESAIGTKVFLTQLEAEQALERQG